MVENPTLLRDVQGDLYTTWLLVPSYWSDARARGVLEDRYGTRPSRVERLRVQTGVGQSTLMRVGPVLRDVVPPCRCSFDDSPVPVGPSRP